MNGRLTRSRDAMVGGVAAGVASWIKVDPALVRIAWAVLVPLTSGAALLAYIVAWVVVPEEPERDVRVVEGTDPESPAVGPTERPMFDEGRATLLIGGGLILVGLWFLARQYLPQIDWGFLWPLIIVGVGVLVLSGALRKR